MITIYGLYDRREPGLIRYIGQTRDLVLVRIARHIDADPLKHAPVRLWLRSLPDLPGWVVLGRAATQPEANDLERHMIGGFARLGFPLINQALMPLCVDCGGERPIGKTNGRYCVPCRSRRSAALYAARKVAA